MSSQFHLKRFLMTKQSQRILEDGYRKIKNPSIGVAMTGGTTGSLKGPGNKMQSQLNFRCNILKQPISAAEQPNSVALTTTATFEAKKKLARAPLYKLYSQRSRGSMSLSSGGSSGRRRKLYRQQKERQRPMMPKVLCRVLFKDDLMKVDDRTKSKIAYDLPKTEVVPNQWKAWNHPPAVDKFELKSVPNEELQTKQGRLRNELRLVNMRQKCDDDETTDSAAMGQYWAQVFKKLQQDVPRLSRLANKSSHKTTHSCKDTARKSAGKTAPPEEPASKEEPAEEPIPETARIMSAVTPSAISIVAKASHANRLAFLAKRNNQLKEYKLV